MKRWSVSLSVLAFLSFVGVWVLAVLLWPKLPGRIPVHFNISGLPDRIVPSSPFQWFLVPGIATGMNLLLGLIPRLTRWLARSHPGWINIPRKADFLRLPEDARLRAVQPVSLLMAGMLVLLNALFAFIGYGMYAVAVGAWTTLPLAAIIVEISCVVVWIVVCTLIFRKVILTEVRAGSVPQA